MRILWNSGVPVSPIAIDPTASSLFWFTRGWSLVVPRLKETWFLIWTLVRAMFSPYWYTMIYIWIHAKIYHHISSNNINKYDMIWFWYVTVSASLILGHDISRHWWPYSFRHIRNNKWLMLSCSACHDPSETNVVSIRVSNWKALRSVPPNPLNFSPPMIRVGW